MSGKAEGSGQSLSEVSGSAGREARVFPMAVLVTASSGRYVCGDFSRFHEFAEFVTGGPVWTHEFGSKGGVSQLIERDLLRQHPDLPTRAEADAYPVTGENWREWLDGIEARLGTSRSVEPIPDYGRTKGPLDTLADALA